jgi:Tol biopolymer transport system component
MVGGASPAWATFPGRSGRIAFETEAGSNIGSVNPDGTGPAKLTHLPASTVAEFPKYSSDGKWIVFDANTPTYPLASWDIYKMTAKGTHLRRLTSDTNGYDDWGGSFSPNGKRIAFVSDRSGISQVWVMGSDGSSPTQVTTIGGINYTSWSPDGKWILFDTAASGNDEVYEIHPNGTGQTQLTFYPFVGSGADWSPGGKLIAFSGTKTGGTYQIWVMSNAGAKPHAITSEAHNAYDPVWSPDGTRIAFDENVSSTEWVKSVPRTGGGVRNVVKGQNPGWQPLP